MLPRLPDQAVVSGLLSRDGPPEDWGHQTPSRFCQRGPLLCFCPDGSLVTTQGDGPSLAPDPASPGEADNLSPAEISWGCHERPSPAGVGSFAPGGQSPRGLTHVGQVPALSKQGAGPLLRLPLTSKVRWRENFAEETGPPVSSGAAPEGSSSEPAARQLRANEVPKVRTPVPVTGSTGSRALQSWTQSRLAIVCRSSGPHTEVCGCEGRPPCPCRRQQPAGAGGCGVSRTHAVPGLREAVPERPRVSEPDRMQGAGDERR